MWKLILLYVVGWSSAASPGTNGDITQPNIQKQLVDEAKVYLFKFGYMIPDPKKNPAQIQEPTQQQVRDALSRFQSAFLYYSSGIVDVPTQAKMSEWRCANNDMDKGQPIPPASKKEIWTKKQLNWKIVNTPRTLSEAQIRSAAHEAFDQWTKATGFKFVESSTAAQPDITITFYDVPQSNLRIAGSASKPHNSHIILDRNQDWAYKSQAPMGISLYHTLLHEIGHVLGLPHSFYRGSIMHPIFKPVLLPFGTLDIVPNVDRLAIRKLYVTAGPPGIEVEEENSNPMNGEENNGIPEGLSTIDRSGPSSDVQQSKCPKHIDSVVAINDQEWLLLRENKVYKLNNRKFVDSGRHIQQVFPRGPQFVNATVSSGPLILLFVERTIYGYEYDGVQFTEAANYPKELHDRVLFYPQGAFPLNNGSVILLSGNVFATYNVANNAPSFLNDKNRYFPHLPDDVRSGIEKTQGFTDAYYMFDEATVSDYDMTSKQVIQLQNIPDFLKCA